jgi:hypoxanthine-guanine phosphoribosyltransferase
MNSKKHIEKAIKNIEDDREITRELLDDAIKWLAIDDARHKDIGMTLAKYVETLQRSNEQLVKLCGLMSKNESTEELTDKDFAKIFDQIQQSEGSDNVDKG